MFRRDGNGSVIDVTGPSFGPGWEYRQGRSAFGSRCPAAVFMDTEIGSFTYRKSKTQQRKDSREITFEVVSLVHKRGVAVA